MRRDSCPRGLLLVVVRLRMVEVAGRRRDDADIDTDTGIDGPLSCLKSKEDPGRNKGRAAATGPVIANGVVVEAEAEGP